MDGHEPTDNPPIILSLAVKLKRARQSPSRRKLLKAFKLARERSAPPCETLVRPGEPRRPSSYVAAPQVGVLRRTRAAMDNAQVAE